MGLLELQSRVPCSEMRLHVRCPAKVNLFLSVGPRDDSGYHPIHTIFQAVGLCDDLFIEPTDGDPEFDCNWPWIDEDNSVCKALKLVSEIATVPPLRIELIKHIPIEAGLGGGSSDAAGLLRGVERLCGATSGVELQTVALAVGADVPFFLRGGRALGRGYGQKLTPMADGFREWYLLAKPDIGCSTAEMYAKLDEHPRTWLEYPDEDAGFYNDFEAVAPEESIELIARLKRLGALDATLCGSGSAVFGKFASEPLAEVACERLCEDFDGQAWVVPTLSRQESLDISVETD